MKITNSVHNQSAFCMAFRTPTGHDLDALNEILFKPYNDVSDKQIRRGLNRFIKMQSKNKRFDVRFKNDCFEVIDTKKANKVINFYNNSTKYPNKLDDGIRRYDIKLNKFRNNELKTAITSLNAVLSMIKDAIIISLFKPQEYLPSAMRKAGDKASDLEKYYLKCKNL